MCIKIINIDNFFTFLPQAVNFNAAWYCDTVPFWKGWNRIRWRKGWVSPHGSDAEPDSEAVVREIYQVWSWMPPLKGQKPRPLGGHSKAVPLCWWRSWPWEWSAGVVWKAVLSAHARILTLDERKTGPLNQKRKDQIIERDRREFGGPQEDTDLDVIDGMNTGCFGVTWPFLWLHVEFNRATLSPWPDLSV